MTKDQPQQDSNSTASAAPALVTTITINTLAPTCDLALPSARQRLFEETATAILRGKGYGDNTLISQLHRLCEIYRTAEDDAAKNLCQLNTMVL